MMRAERLANVKKKQQSFEHWPEIKDFYTAIRRKTLKQNIKQILVLK